MSEQENVQVVQRAYEAASQGDMRSLKNLMTADVVWRLPQMPSVPFAGEWLGRDGVERFFATVAQSQDMMEFQPEHFIAQGDSVVVLGRFEMRVKATGHISRSEWAHVWTLKDRQVSLFREYVDTAAVIAAHAQDTRAP
jgi:hypothetical protein